MDKSAVKKQILERHNYYRRKHGVPEMKWDSAAEKIAQAYSDKLASSGAFEHSGNTYTDGSWLGENLFKCWGGTECILNNDPSDNWYSEISSYDFKNPGYISGTGHFTQMVWKGSTKLGCGIGVGSDGSNVVTCNYHPGGNVLGYFEQNVFPPTNSGDDSGSKSGFSAKNFFIVLLVIAIVVGLVLTAYFYHTKKYCFHPNSTMSRSKFEATRAKFEPKKQEPLYK